MEVFTKSLDRFEIFISVEIVKGISSLPQTLIFSFIKIMRERWKEREKMF